MKLNNEIKHWNWNQKLKSKIEIENWVSKIRNWILKFKIEIQNWNLSWKLELNIEDFVRNWKNLRNCKFL